MNEDQIVGFKPRLEGKPLQDFISQAYWYEGELIENANVVWMKQDNQWHHLCFDETVIVWRLYDHGPTYEKPEESGIWNYPLENLNEKYSLFNVSLESIEQQATIGSACVLFKFQNGFQLKFECIKDVANIKK